VGTSTSRDPTESYRITISFGCDPERVDELTRTIFTQVDSLQTTGTTEKYVEKVREQTLRTLERNLRENGYWMSILQSSDQSGLSPEDAVEGPRRFMDTLTPAKIQATAQQYLDADNYVKVVLFPESFEQ
jgi:zinc protease